MSSDISSIENKYAIPAHNPDTYVIFLQYVAVLLSFDDTLQSKYINKYVTNATNTAITYGFLKDPILKI